MKPMVCSAVLYNPYGTIIEVAVVKGLSDGKNTKFSSELFETDINDLLHCHLFFK